MPALNRQSRHILLVLLAAGLGFVALPWYGMASGFWSFAWAVSAGRERQCSGTVAGNDSRSLLAVAFAGLAGHRFDRRHAQGRSACHGHRMVWRSRAGLFASSGLRHRSQGLELRRPGRSVRPGRAADRHGGRCIRRRAGIAAPSLRRPRTQGLHAWRCLPRFRHCRCGRRDRPLCLLSGGPHSHRSGLVAGRQLFNRGFRRAGCSRPMFGA